MPSRLLPPFAALRAFEAVARTLSFTRAAQELGVTQAAVSRQVRALEQELGIRLVDRHTTHNALSTSGRTLFAALRDGMDCMDAGVRAVSPRPGRTILTASVAPFFSACWLTPRIMHFIEANPAIDLRLHHSYEPPDYRRDQIDLGINWGDGRWSGVKAEQVFDGSLTPVCSPEFLRRRKLGNEPGDLLGQPLFYEFHQKDWADWFRAAGVELSGCPVATRINDSNALRRIALEGHGVALFFRSLMQDDLIIGRLVQPFDRVVDTGCHYFLNYPSDRELSAGGKRFRRWLLSELQSEKHPA
jgi:DNA-binding transcriptional LysR family regulator